MTKLYKILDENGCSCNGGSAQWSLPTRRETGEWMPGEWMPGVDGDLKLCETGYHLMDAGQLLNWVGPALYEAEYRGERIDGDDKIVVRSARLLRRVETWNDHTLRLFAVWCAREALKLLDESKSDPRSVEAVDVAERYALGQATVGELAAAKDAARDAAWDAAWTAAWTAAWAAARDAARDAEIHKLIEMLGL